MGNMKDSEVMNQIVDKKISSILIVSEGINPIKSPCWAIEVQIIALLSF